MKYDYDIAVVGAGSGWLTVAFGLASAGKKVVLIEKWPIWWDCTNFWCVPSKALIDIAKHQPELGFKKALFEVRNRRQLIQDEETPEKIESHGLKVLKGTASFTSDHKLHIDGDDHCHVTAEKIILSTGSRARKIELGWVDEADILTNHEIFEETGDIKRLIVVWGGYIGCELAESIAALGVEVHVLQRNLRLIPREEEQSSELLEEILTEKWIHIHTGVNIVSAKDKKLKIVDIHGKNGEEIEYDKILVATGRQSNIEKLDLEKVDVKSDANGIVVDKYNRTNKKHIFAIWDCVSWNPQFTHWANHEWRWVIRNILVPVFKKSVRKASLPAVLYTHYEVARVGKTRKELLQKYSSIDIVTKKIDFSHNDRSKVTNDTTGFVLIHFKRVSGKILGATIFGTHAGELIGQITYAMDNKLSAYKLAKSIQAYPTKSDLIKRVADSFVVDTLSHAKREAVYFVKSNILQIMTALIWGSLISIFIWYKWSTGQSFEDISLLLYNSLSSSSIGPLLFILAYTVRPIVLFPGTFMTFMGGALFWPIYGVIYTVIAATSSAVFAYFLGMLFGKKLLPNTQGGIIWTLKNQLDREPFMSVLMTRLLFFPFDLVNYACGFLRANFAKYTLATFVWIIPWTGVFVLAGSAFYGSEIRSFSEALSNVDTKLLLFAAGLFLLITLFAKLLRKIKK